MLTKTLTADESGKLSGFNPGETIIVVQFGQGEALAKATLQDPAKNGGAIRQTLSIISTTAASAAATPAAKAAKPGEAQADWPEGQRGAVNVPEAPAPAPSAEPVPEVKPGELAASTEEAPPVTDKKAKAK